MKIKEENPPNINEILKYLTPNYGVIYCYGDTIYNPDKVNITADLVAHEQVHTRQQGVAIDAWWYKYLIDSEFRLSQELEAYGEQYKFVKEKTSGKLREYILDRMAQALSGETYGNLLNFAQAKSKIRNYSK